MRADSQEYKLDQLTRGEFQDVIKHSQQEPQGTYDPKDTKDLKTKNLYDVPELCTDYVIIDVVP